MRRFPADAGDNVVRLWDATTGTRVHLPVITHQRQPLAVFSPSGQSLLIASESSMTVLDLAPRAAAPHWLIQLAEFASTQSSYNLSRTPDLAAIRALQARLLAATGSDPWSRFGKWYFTDSARRSVSPWSYLSLEAYVKLLIANGDRASLEYANSLSREFPSWSAKIRPLLAKLPPAPTARADDAN